jgi:mercuric ion binding protein
MKHIAIAVFSVLLYFSNASHASIKVTVNGMVCSFCAQGIEKSISKLSATKAVLVDLKNKVVVIEPREGAQLKEQDVIREIREAGYDVVRIETIPQTVAQFREEKKATR